MKPLHILALLVCVGLLASSTIAHAQCSGTSFPNIGGQDILGECATTGSDYGHAVVSWTSASPRTCLLEVNASAGSPGSDPAFNVFNFSGSLGTSCSLTMPVIAGQGNCFSASGSTNATAYRSGDTSWAANPFGTQINQNCFTAATPPPGTFSGNTTLSGPSATSGYPFLGHRSNIGISEFWLGGTTAPNFVVTSLTWDTVNVPANTSGSMVANTQIQYIQSNGEIVNSGQNNYATSVCGSGHYSGLYQDSTNYGWQKSFIQIYPNSSAATGSHQLCATFQFVTSQCPATASTAGPPITQCVTVDFTNPTFTASAPGSYPSIANLDLWNDNISTYLTQLIYFNTGNLSTPGSYNNDAGSAYLYDQLPSYDPARAQIGLYDYLNAAAVSWTTSHSYAHGAIVLANGYWWETAAACTSASSGTGPSGTTVNATVIDNTCTWTNYGTTAYWQASAQRIGQQQRNWQLLFNHVTWAEYNLFPYGLLMMGSRANATLSTSLEASAIAYALYPFVSSSYITYPQKVQYSCIASPAVNTWRIAAYALDDYVSQWYASGTKPVDGGVDEIARCTDVLLDGLMQVTACSPTAAVSSSWPCPAQVLPYSVNFDIGFTLETLRHVCDAEKSFTGTCDPALPFVIKNTVDWMYSNQFNQIGEHSQPYGMFGVPNNSTNYNQQQTTLNPLICGTMAWLGAIDGNSNLPTSGVAEFTAADNYCANTFISGCSTAKGASQCFKDFYPYYQYRTGNWTWDQDQIQPALNAYDSSWPHLTGPILQATFPLTAAPSVSGTVNTSSTGNAMTWVSGVYFDPSWLSQNVTINGNIYGVSAVPSSTSITLSSSPGNHTGVNYSMPTPACGYVSSGTGQCQWWSSPTVSSFTRLAVAPSDPWTAPQIAGAACTNLDSGANVCLNTSNPSGLTTGTYYVTMGGTDSNGNTEQSELTWATGRCCFALTIDSSGPTITVSCSLPSGTVGVSYTGTCVASGGTGPYTYATIRCVGIPSGTCTSTDISGSPAFSFTGGTYSGTPSVAGSATLSVQATDAVGSRGAWAGYIRIGGASAIGTIIQGGTITGATVGP